MLLCFAVFLLLLFFFFFFFFVCLFANSAHLYYYLQLFLPFNPIALRKAKIVCNLSISECSRVKKMNIFILKFKGRL